MVESGAAAPTEDPAVRAAFLLVNDLALILLRNQIAAAIGVDPLTPEGIDRWAGRSPPSTPRARSRAPAKESPHDRSPTP